MQKKYFWAPLLFALSLYADKAPIAPSLEVSPSATVESPWLTGPLFASSGVTIPPGHYNIEPYLFAVANTGVYNPDWSVPKKQTLWDTYFQTSIQIGICSWLDCQFTPTVYYSFTDNAASWAWGDLPFQFDIQLYRNSGKVTDWLTGVRLTLRETFPTGKYQNLNPQKKKTDIGGQGSWQSAVGLAWGNLWYLGGKHFLTGRFNLFYTLPAPTRVKNLNTYGGGMGTKGTVYPGQNLQLDIGLECSLTQNWALAMDILGGWSAKTRFSGHSTAPNAPPSSWQFSLAPAVEYNWSSNLGIIFGPWFTIAGRNTPQFASAIFALNYYN